VLRIAVAGMALVFVGAVMVDVAAVFFVLEVVPGGTATVFGLTAGAWGAGALVGARLAGRLTGTRALLRALGAGHAVMAAALVLCGLAPSVIVLLSTWLVGGMANGAQNVSVQGLVRARSEPHLRGRAFSATSSVFQTLKRPRFSAALIRVAALG